MKYSITLTAALVAVLAAATAFAAGLSLGGSGQGGVSIGAPSVGINSQTPVDDGLPADAQAESNVRAGAEYGSAQPDDSDTPKGKHRRHAPKRPDAALLKAQAEADARAEAEAKEQAQVNANADIGTDIGIRAKAKSAADFRLNE